MRVSFIRITHYSAIWAYIMFVIAQLVSFSVLAKWLQYPQYFCSQNYGGYSRRLVPYFILIKTCRHFNSFYLAYLDLSHCFHGTRFFFDISESCSFKDVILLFEKKSFQGALMLLQPMLVVLMKMVYVELVKLGMF